MIEKQPFERYRLDEEKEEGERYILSVSLNKYEKEELDKIKQQFRGVKSESTILKRCAFLGMNVIQNLDIGVLFHTSFIKNKHKKHKNLMEIKEK